MEKTSQSKTIQTWALWGEPEEAAYMEQQRKIAKMKAGPLLIRGIDQDGQEYRRTFKSPKALEKGIQTQRLLDAIEIDNTARDAKEKEKPTTTYDLSPVADAGALPLPLPEESGLNLGVDALKIQWGLLSTYLQKVKSEQPEKEKEIPELRFFDELIAQKAPPIDPSTLRASFWCLLAPGLANMLFDTLSLPLPFPAGSAYTTLAAAYLVNSFQGHTEKQGQKLEAAKMAYTFLRDAENIPLSIATAYVASHKEDLPSLSKIEVVGRKQVANEILQAVLEPTDALRAMRGKGPRPAPHNG